MTEPASPDGSNADDDRDVRAARVAHDMRASRVHRAVRTVLFVVFGGLVLWGVIAGITGHHRPDRVRSLAAQLRCPVCNGESVADSPAASARAIENQVRRQVADGWTDDQVLQYFEQRFGPSIRLAPPRSGSTLVLWIAPIVAASGGAIAVAGMVAPGRTRSVMRWTSGALGAGAVVALVVAGASHTTARPTLQPPSAGADAVPGTSRDLSTVTEAEMEQVIAANPNVIGMRLALAERYLDEGDVAGALRHTAVAVELPATDQDYERALRLHGWASALNGAPAAGAEYLRAALALSPTDRDALYFLAKVTYEGLHDPQAALAPLAQLAAMDMDADQRAVVDALHRAVQAAATAGTSGTAGTAGTSGTSGTSGTVGTVGAPASSGNRVPGSGG